MERSVTISNHAQNVARNQKLEEQIVFGVELSFPQEVFYQKLKRLSI
jgi:hypothetical protein